ncbi:MAG: prevent-host-death protein [Acidobacteria bacterium]|nr:MAG: prevent-host-death protein [Acidobacteriota bacterium]PYY10772.1 MAG: prevent-host-death protein [Acidobacteriota bacterium]
MGSWQVQDAKARFSEFLDATIKKGPQVVTRRGVETAVLVPIEEWNRLQRAARPSLKALLLTPGARFENVIPERHKLRRRKVVELK